MKPDQDVYSFDNPHREAKLYIPRTFFFLSSLVLQHLKRKYSSEKTVDFSVAEGFLYSLKTKQAVNLATNQQPILALAPKLRSKPWWTATDSQEIERINKTVQSFSQIVIAEYLEQDKKGVITKSYRAATRYGEGGKAWTGYQLSHIMGVRAEAKERFPKTSEMIEACGFRVLSADFLELSPGGRLPIHTDGTNLVLACHLVIRGNDRCGLSVNREVESIETGKVVFFDQSYPHTAWNHGEASRVVLILSLLHPDINQKEFEIAKEFVRKTRRVAMVSAPILLVDLAITVLLTKFTKKIFK